MDKKMINDTAVFEISAVNQCWTVATFFTFGRSRIFGHKKLRPLAVDRSRSRRFKNFKNIS